MQEEDRDARLVRRVTLMALDLSRDPDPSDDIRRLLDRAACQHGEDAIREFVRVTLHGKMDNCEAGNYVYGDAALGMQTGIAVRHITNQIDEAP